VAAGPRGNEDACAVAAGESAGAATVAGSADDADVAAVGGVDGDVVVAVAVVADVVVGAGGAADGELVPRYGYEGSFRGFDHTGRAVVAVGPACDYYDKHSLNDHAFAGVRVAPDTAD